MRTLARSGLVVFVGLVALEHLLRPGLPPAERFISEYGRGATQPLHVAAFGAWAVACGGCAVVAARRRSRPVARVLTVAGFAAAAAGAVLAAVFATQTVAGELPAGVARTAGGRLHDLGTLFILGGLIVAALASLRLVPVRRYRLGVGLLGVVLLAIVPTLVALGLDAPGLGQRGFVLTGVAFEWWFTAQTAWSAASGSPNRQ